MRIIISPAKKMNVDRESRKLSYAEAGCRFITVSFAEEADGKLKQKGTMVKMARGEAVRFLAETGGKDPEKLKEFDRMGYHCREELSDAEHFVFVKSVQYCNSNVEF